RLLWLTYESRHNPDISCETVLDTIEWQSLCVSVSKNPIPPEKPPTLREAIRMIASLGGFLCRKSDGEPGVKTIWRGLRRLHDIAATWKLAQQTT
ncbi:IS4 family transposase, partial [Brunnivagina elsteri]